MPDDDVAEIMQHRALPVAEVAATTMVVRLLLNFGETIVKP